MKKKQNNNYEYFIEKIDSIKLTSNLTIYVSFDVSLFKVIKIYSLNMTDNKIKYNLNIFQKEAVKDYMKIIKEVDSNLSDRMRSHYKKQIMEILSDEEEFRNTNENLVYKLLAKVSELQDKNEEQKYELDHKKRD